MEDCDIGEGQSGGVVVVGAQLKLQNQLEMSDKQDSYTFVNLMVHGSTPPRIARDRGRRRVGHRWCRPR